MSQATARSAAGATANTADTAFLRQLYALDDLRLFVMCHSVSNAPLPLLNWSLGLRGYDASAQLRDGEGAVETLTAYAAALGTTVHRREKPDRTVYSVRAVLPQCGRERPRPRTRVLIRLSARHGRPDRSVTG
ncbi:MAG: hypothetical protein ACRDVE_04860 [Actinocrinis sp.]